jgi:hypothetical protein
MTFIDRELKALKAERDRYVVLRNRCIMGTPDFFFYVGRINEVDEIIDRLRERT